MATVVEACLDSFHCAASARGPRRSGDVAAQRANHRKRITGADRICGKVNAGEEKVWDRNRRFSIQSVGKRRQLDRKESFPIQSFPGRPAMDGRKIFQRKMKATQQNYISPEVKIIELACREVIAASGGDFTMNNPFSGNTEEE